PERVVDMPISEQAFTSFATGAAMAGRRPLVEFQIPSLLFLVFEQIANQAHKFSLMTGGQASVPVTYLVPGSGSRFGWAGQLADRVSVEVFDPRTLYPFDWNGLAESLERTGRLVVIDDSNRSCGIGAEILATAAEEMRLVAPPKRVTRPDGAVLPFAPALDM